MNKIETSLKGYCEKYVTVPVARKKNVTHLTKSNVCSHQFSGQTVMAIILCVCVIFFFFFSLSLPFSGCEAFSRSGAIHPTKERTGRSSGQHESFWRARWWRRRRRGSRRSQWRSGNHSHTQLPHHLLPFRPGEPT